MINTIIKRDGTQENFDADKLNKWGEWASTSLGKNVAWGDVVLNAVSVLGEKATSIELQNALIDTCLNKRTWSYNRMAGRLETSMLYKRAFSDRPLVMDSKWGNVPLLKSLHTLLVTKNLMSSDFYNDFSDEEYAELGRELNHDLDLTYPHYQIKQITNKYSLKDRTSDEVYETPQFIYMRVAMRMAQNKPDRIKHAKRFYYFFSTNKINIPTPYFTNSGTDKNGFSSCCVYKANDTARSLAVGDHIAYTMTYSSAGIGAFIRTRAEGAPIRGGTISHRGKMMYYKMIATSVDANMQNGRGGAATVTYECIDPDWKTIQGFKHPLTPVSRQVRGIDYSMAFNKFFIGKAARNEEVALFSLEKAPEVYEALTSPDMEHFEQVYNKAVKKGLAQSFVNARTVLLGAVDQAIETGRHYYTNLTEMNTHTPFNDPIYQSNLCQEIALPTEGYESMMDLYSTDENVKGEVGTCSLAGIVSGNIKSDEEYAEAAYYCLRMIHTAIHEADYELPHVGYTATRRNSAGVGIVGLAHWMAKNKLKYDDITGQKAIHELAETHYYHLVKASLKMSEEFGLAPWMHKTAWPQGWTPLSTYNKNVDSIADFEYKRDWDALSKEIKANGGIHNSVLVAHMPAESSSISSGTTNGLYPIRGITLNKSNDDDSIAWIAPDSEKLEKHYQNAYLIDSLDIIKFYGIIQKFTDQAISADLWKVVVGTEKLSSTELLSDVFASVKYGMKSRYYINSKTSKEIGLNASETLDAELCVGCTI